MLKFFYFYQRSSEFDPLRWHVFFPLIKSNSTAYMDLVLFVFLCPLSIFCPSKEIPAFCLSQIRREPLIMSMFVMWTTVTFYNAGLYIDDKYLNILETFLFVY